MPSSGWFQTSGLSYWVEELLRSSVWVRSSRADLFQVDLAAGTVDWQPSQTRAPFDSARRKNVSRILELFISPPNPALLLHGCAVGFRQGAACFLGVSGEGKSTMGAGFLSKGHPLFSDDVCLIRRNGAGLLLEPGFPAMQLRPSSARWLAGTGTRLNLALAKVSGSGPVPLKTLYLLRRSRHRCPIRVEPVKGREALLALTRNTPHLIVRSPEILRRNFQFTIGLLREVPVKRLTYPTGFRSLPSVCEAVLRDMNS